MSRARPTLGTPFGADGPWLAAILNVLCDVRDGLDEVLVRLPTVVGGEPTTAEVPQMSDTPAAVVVRPVQEPAPATPPALPEAPAEPDGDEAVASDGAPPPDPDPNQQTVLLPDPPPRAGRGSSAAVWRQWASAADVTVADGLSRDDIIAACEQAGVL